MLNWTAVFLAFCFGSLLGAAGMALYIFAHGGRDRNGS